jgi:hypothetical protein
MLITVLLLITSCQILPGVQKGNVIYTPNNAWVYTDDTSENSREVYAVINTHKTSDIKDDQIVFVVNKGGERCYQ